MQVDNMSLCGPNFTYESAQYIKGNANRIHRQAAHLDEAIQQKGKMGLNIALGCTIQNVQEIMISLETGEPRTFTNKPISRGTVKSELLILAQDLIKVINATSQINPSLLDDSLKIQTSQIKNLSTLMIVTALTQYEEKADILFLGSRFDKNSTLQFLPRDVIDLIIKAAFEVKVDAVRNNLAQELVLSKISSSSIQRPCQARDNPLTLAPIDEPSVTPLKKKSKFSSFKSIINFNK